MQTNRIFLAAALACVALAEAGCFTHNLPRDAFMQGAHSKIVTPWGTHELIIDMAATGTAAKNVTLPEIPAPSAAKASTVGKAAK